MNYAVIHSRTAAKSNCVSLLLLRCQSWLRAFLTSFFFPRRCFGISTVLVCIVMSTISLKILPNKGRSLVSMLVLHDQPTAEVLSAWVNMWPHSEKMLSISAVLWLMQQLKYSRQLMKSRNHNFLGISKLQARPVSMLCPEMPVLQASKWNQWSENCSVSMLRLMPSTAQRRNFSHRQRSSLWHCWSVVRQPGAPAAPCRNRGMHGQC